MKIVHCFVLITHSFNNKKEIIDCEMRLFCSSIFSTCKTIRWGFVKSMNGKIYKYTIYLNDEDWKMMSGKKQQRENILRVVRVI